MDSTTDDAERYVTFASIYQRIERDIILDSTRAGFLEVVDLAAARLRKTFDDGWYGLKATRPDGEEYSIVRQWQSRVDAERTQERAVMHLRIRQRGEKLRVLLDYYHYDAAPTAQAALVLDTIAEHYPDCSLSPAPRAGVVEPTSAATDAGDQVKDGEIRYWTEIYRQARASGNITRYLADRNIPKSSYYAAIRQYRLRVQKLD